MYFSNYCQLVKQKQQQKNQENLVTAHIPLSSADSPDSMNIVLFFIRECHIDNCVR